MKVHELLFESQYTSFIPFPNAWGGWLHSSGNFIATHHEDGHWDKVDENPKTFGLPSDVDTDDVEWDAVFNQGWIRVVFEPKFNTISLDGELPSIKTALNRYRKPLNKMMHSQNLTGIEISEKVGVGGITISDRHQLNNFLNT